jgi:hyperosmotically inducible periplasmic protein
MGMRVHASLCMLTVYSMILRPFRAIAILLLLSSLLPAFSWGHAQAALPKPGKVQDAYTAALSHEIHHQLLVLPFYSVFDSISFSLEGGRVTLTGQVLRRALKEQAEAAVKSVEGITVVVNQIEVLPVSASDDDLRDAVYRSIYEDPTLARYAVQNIPPIHIVIENGNVTLEGPVESAADKKLAATRAATASNVHSVKNNLIVHPKESTAK